MKNIVTALLIGLVFIANALAQDVKEVAFAESQWDIAAKKYEFKEYKGKPSLYLENGVANLKEASLKNGVIEYDVLFTEERKFLAVHFRQQDKKNYEEFYLRAHQSGNPDAMQYTPVFNGIAGWQLYYGKGHSTAYRYNFGEWIHVKLLIANDKMDIFINDMDQPVLHVNELKMETKSGSIGFSTTRGGAYFANLSYQPMENVELVSKVEENPEPELGTIQKWDISEAFAQSELEQVYSLKDKKEMDQLSWKAFDSEFTGTINLAKTAAFSKETNTVFAKVTIIANKNQVKKLDFGYSDIASVFVNDQLIYSGQRTFRTRDYRYLGTIGYFDAVYLDLKKGKNEIVFAITENFGGWGLKAKLENMEGIEVE